MKKYELLSLHRWTGCAGKRTGLPCVSALRAKRGIFFLRSENGEVPERNRNFLPSREDSYERLLEKDKQFAAPGKSVEQLASEHLEAEQMRFCLAQLTDEERKLISLLFYQEKTEQEIGNMLHISQQSVNKRKQTLLLKMRKIFEEFF